MPLTTCCHVYPTSSPTSASTSSSASASLFSAAASTAPAHSIIMISITSSTIIHFSSAKFLPTCTVLLALLRSSSSCVCSLREKEREKGRTINKLYQHRRTTVSTRTAAAPPEPVVGAVVTQNQSPLNAIYLIFDRRVPRNGLRK